MRLSWNEIRARAGHFAHEWKDETYEKGECQSFYNDFFQIFGVTRRRVASFEEPVKKLDGRYGFIDLFWKGVLLVEQKSGGGSLTKAKTQAFDYFPGLKESELPRHVLVSDFQTLELYDLDEGTETKFSLTDLSQHVEAFGFILGVEKRTFRDQDPVNIRAAELMGQLHDALKAAGYAGHDLERFLVRLVFCLFADDTGIFEPRGIFFDLIASRTREDGSDVGPWLSQLFQVLNTDYDDRPTNLDEDLRRFAYINGDLFQDRLGIPSFDGELRTRLLAVCAFSWDAISPAIFGSLFQSVMKADQRRAVGAHYTSEKNILKVIQPLFMDDLRAEFARLRARKDAGRRRALESFQATLGALTFFDPACGCGNFLIIAYRELRDLELEVVRELHPRGESDFLDVAHLSRIDVHQFYGIELSEFPARIAEVALWMMDHIMNGKLSLEFGDHYARIPLKASPHIRVGNALTIDWQALLPASACSFVLGNPPFVGHQWRNKDQQDDMRRVWGQRGQVNRLDYVTCWFKKSTEYAAGNKAIRIAFVSTNSITQGEQVGILWPVLLANGTAIAFAHRTFQWNSEARGKAAVHCVIIGLAFEPSDRRRIYEYDDLRGDPHVSTVKAINGYLIDGPQYAIPARTQPRHGLLEMHKGSQPTDGARLKQPDGSYETSSNLILDRVQRDEILTKEPAVAKWLRPYVGGDELISGEWRWCLWLKDANPSELRASKLIAERLERVRTGRLKSPTKSVREFAKYPTLFTQDRQPTTSYLAIPEVSSETREYVPIAMLGPDIIASNKLQIIPGASLVYFGILTSAMHMAWMRTIGGRLKSDYSYSPAIYNSFPWPSMSQAQEDSIRNLAQRILTVRAGFENSSLDDLYEHDRMPPPLRKAHGEMDKAVDLLYRRNPFQFERERVEHLFSLYEALSEPLAPPASRRRARKS